MGAPENFAAWMSTHIANDRQHGRTVYRYHPRSDYHSRALCQLILADLLAACPVLAAHARMGSVVGGVNAKVTFSNGNSKTLDLAIGLPVSPGRAPVAPLVIEMAPIGQLRISIEAKQCMTEHSKTKPRLFDELSSSHEIVHRGVSSAIACGIVVVNIAERYASPTRQIATGDVLFTQHAQPAAARSIVEHLRRLERRENIGDAGFDAFSTIVTDCDNTGGCALHESDPAPQPGELDHYRSFIDHMSRAYAARFP